MDGAGDADGATALGLIAGFENPEGPGLRGGGETGLELRRTGGVAGALTPGCGAGALAVSAAASASSLSALWLPCTC
jgi:hypothetical protein